MKAEGEEEATGLPGLRTWRRVYLAVLAIFAAWVAILAAITGVFS
jgi:hypothetical protein